MSLPADVERFYQERAENCKALIANYAREIRSLERLLVRIEKAHAKAKAQQRFVVIPPERHVGYSHVIDEDVVAVIEEQDRRGVSKSEIARQVGCPRQTVTRVLLQVG